MSYPRSKSSNIVQISLHIIAISVLILTIWSNIQLWYIPHTGLGVNPESGVITSISVKQEKSASEAGFQLGDRIIQAYGLSRDQSLVQLNLIPFMGRQGQNIVFIVERKGKQITLSIPYNTPSLSFQIEKLINILLSLICWLTGYSIGIIRRHDSHKSSIAALFWILTSGITGIYLFAYYASLPIMLIIQLIIINTIFPLSIYTHVYFPYRPISTIKSKRSATLFILYTIFSTITSLLIIFTSNVPITRIVVILSFIWPFAILVGFILVSLLLFQSYKNLNVAHIRRNIQFIISSCLITALLWLILLELPIIINRGTLVDQSINIIAAIVPLSYFLSTRDTYRINIISLQALSHILTIFSLLTFFLMLRAILNLSDLSPLWIAVFFVALYQPSQRIINKIIPILSANNSYHHIDKAINDLTSTLNQPELVHITTKGIKDTFSNPPIAFYKGDITDLNTLSLQSQNNLPNLPYSIPNGNISTFLCNNPSISIENRFILTSIQDTININEEQLLHHPGVVLWCPIVHAQGYLLGAFLIGMKGDLDPYRDRDLNELRRLLNATALALTNSAAYEQQLRSEALIRQLYQRLQESQDKTAADIARDIHDEVINGSILLNTQSISYIIANISDAHLHDELSLILETDLSVIESLRMICQRLQPVNIEDPMGLPNIIRSQIQRISPLWNGECHLSIKNTPIEIEPKVQAECMRITREALNNIIKHANADKITVTISYPSTDNKTTDITITDNGKSANKIEQRSGHWGIQNMHESARSINGTLQINSTPGKGTTVILSF